MTAQHLVMPRRTPSTQARSVPGTGEVVLLHPATGTAVVLDQVSYRVYLCCDGTTAQATAAARAGLEEAALGQVLSRLADAGLIMGRSGVTRRAALAGGALLGAAGVVSIALPSAAAATSGSGGTGGMTTVTPNAYAGAVVATVSSARGAPPSRTPRCWSPCPSASP